MMLAILSSSWKILALRAAAAILFGLTALVWPGLTLAFLVILVGAFFFVHGLFGAVLAIRAAASQQPWGVLLLEGLAGIGVGVMTFIWPGSAAVGLLLVVAGWSFFTGGTQIVIAIRLRREMKGEWLLIVSGLLGIGFGVVLVAMPAVGFLAMTWIIAWFALVSGFLLLTLSMQLRRAAKAGRRTIDAPSPPAAVAH